MSSQFVSSILMCAPYAEVRAAPPAAPCPLCAPTAARRPCPPRRQAPVELVLEEEAPVSLPYVLMTIGMMKVRPLRLRLRMRLRLRLRLRLRQLLGM